MVYKSMMKRGQKLILLHFTWVKLLFSNYRNLVAFPMDVHEESPEFEVGENLCQFVVCKLDMFSVQFHLILSVYFGVELFERSAILMVNEDNFPK